MRHQWPMMRQSVSIAVTIVLGLLWANVAPAAEPPRRVVSYNACADQFLLALADPDQIAALSPYAIDPTVSVLADKARAFKRIDFQAESVIPLDPDLVLVGPQFGLVTRPILRALGFRVVAVDVVNDLAAARAQIRAVAELLGHPERGEAMVTELDAALARLAAAPHPPPSTALLVENGGYTIGPESLAATLMAQAGFTPPPGAPSGFGGIVPLEKLVALRPDFLVMSSVLDQANGQGALYLTHPALRALYPPDRRILLPARYTLCGGPSLVAALDYLTTVVSRLVVDR
jgi:iron complex transport system substrate-binding protein